MILISIKHDGRSPGMMKREWNNHMKWAYRQVGVFHFRQHIPKHFTRAGGREYGYKPRKGEAGNPGAMGFLKSYSGQKKKEHGHMDPLVYTGTTRDETVSNMNVTSTFKQAKISLRARALNFRSPHSEINMLDEIRAISDRERNVLNRIFSKAVEKSIRRSSASKTEKLA